MSDHQTSTLTREAVTMPAGHKVGALAPLALGIGLLGTAGFVAGTAGGMVEPVQAYSAWLTAFVYVLSVALGAMFFVLIQFASRAGWSVLVRRFAEHLMIGVCALALLSIPIFLGGHDLYHWMDHHAIEHDAMLKWKEPYLNAGFFYGRSAFYFIVWIAIAVFFWKKSAQQDESGDPEITRKLQIASGPSILLFALTLSFASFDWIMSLDPHWFSTIFGVYYFAGSLVAVFSILILWSLILNSTGLMGGIVNAEHRHDLGKLLFGFTVFWTYIAFSQYFLIWYANIPEETLWYAHRMEGSWLNVSIALALGHFVIPFFFLLPRQAKRSPLTLAPAALWMLAIHYVDMYWLVMPNFQHHGIHPHWIDLAALLGVGGLYFGAVLLLTRRRALAPFRDPRLPESLHFENI